MYNHHLPSNGHITETKTDQLTYLFNGNEHDSLALSLVGESV